MTRADFIRESMEGRGMPLATLQALDRAIWLRIPEVSLDPNIRSWLSDQIGTKCDLLKELERGTKKSAKHDEERRQAFNALVDGVAIVTRLCGSFTFMGVTYTAEVCHGT